MLQVGQDAFMSWRRERFKELWQRFKKPACWVQLIIALAFLVIGLFFFRPAPEVSPASSSVSIEIALGARPEKVQVDTDLIRVNDVTSLLVYIRSALPAGKAASTARPFCQG